MEMRLNREASRAAPPTAAAGACVRKKVPESGRNGEKGGRRERGRGGRRKTVKSQNFKEEDWLGDHPVAAGPDCSLNVR